MALDGVSLNTNAGKIPDEQVEIKTSNGTFKVAASLFDGIELKSENYTDLGFSFDTVKLKNGVNVSLNDSDHILCGTTEKDAKLGDAIITIDEHGDITAENAGNLQISSKNGKEDWLEVTAKNSHIGIRSDADKDWIRTKTEGDDACITFRPDVGPAKNTNSTKAVVETKSKPILPQPHKPEPATVSTPDVASIFDPIKIYPEEVPFVK